MPKMSTFFNLENGLFFIYISPNHEVTLCVLLLMFGVIVTNDNCAVFPNIMGGFAIIHSTV
jgi:hypothetical protein